MKNTFKILAILIITITLNSCGSKNSKTKNQNEDVYAKSQTRGDIIKRSGSKIGSDNTKSGRKLQMDDALNRIKSGGTLFGEAKKSGNIFGDNQNNQTVSMGMPINPFLWKASLETIDFMPLSSADPFSGSIITEWYTGNSEGEERCKINIFIRGVELKTNNLKVNSFCQTLSSSNTWVDQRPIIENNTKLENAILNKAKKIKLKQN